VPYVPFAAGSRITGAIATEPQITSPAGPVASVVMMTALHSQRSGSSLSLLGSARVREILFPETAEVVRHRGVSHRSAAASSEPVGDSQARGSVLVRHRGGRAAVTTHEVQIDARTDPQWAAYRAFVD
jgi:hypothetical protein